MTNPEMSNEFDVLFNSITSNQAPGLNEYEKSVFLTKAQWQVVKHYANPRSNKTQQGLDESQKRQIDFSTLMKTVNCNTSTTSTKIDSRSKVFILPQDAFIIINERVTSGTENFTVMPISFEQYDKLMLKPYPYPVKRGVWRLITNQGTDAPIVEIIGNLGSATPTYTIRYIKKPRPIVLETLEGTGYSVDGEDKFSTCELPEELHNEVLQRAVELASAAYKGDLSTQIALGANSQTDIGVVTSQDR
jgi:hypothetical protein